MAAPTEYRWTDASAPVITGQNATLINALSKILVDGYGSKPAAGWTKPYTSGTDYASFRQGSGRQCYVAVVDTAAQLARVVGYETMSDATSGTGPFPTSAQFSGGLYVRKSITADSTARPWVCWATDRTFFLWIWGSQSASTSPPSGSTGDVNHFGFGQTLQSRAPSEAYDVFLMCASNSSATDTSGVNTRQVFHAATAQQGTATPGHYMPRAATQTGTSVAVQKKQPGMWSALSDSTSGNNTANFPDAHGAWRLARFGLFDVSSFARRGFIPGMFFIQNSGVSTFDQFEVVRGDGGGTMNNRSFAVVISANGSVAVETGDWGEP